ncbi:DUF120 domain-containing protein, partial [Candidatus Woesearchaeota archaeon]|nr:DUF120 domain-containing protein [Candidatus Woesearchaeota archaeon]
ARHPDNIVEIISKINLRKHFNLKNKNTITLKGI